MNIIGIDSGSSTIKIIEVNEQKEILHKLILNKVPTMQALEIFINKEKIDVKNIQKIVLTGVGKDEIKEDIYNIPTIKVDEFISIGMGGLNLSNQKKGLVVSIGTGTAFVEARGKKFKHIGGTGIGGGTLLNLCKQIADCDSINKINETIKNGNLNNIDLRIQDITTKEIKTLPPDITSANFGKLSENATKEDLCMGIVNMIFETIGVMAVFGAQRTRLKNIIVVGNVATMPYIKIVLKKIEKLHNVKFIIPKQAQFATVIGAIETIK